MRCSICDSVLQLHSRSDICPTCQHHVQRARMWYENPLDFSADSDLGQGHGQQQAVHIEQEEETD